VGVLTLLNGDNKSVPAFFIMSALMEKKSMSRGRKWFLAGEKKVL
jgi:hypothetical protein